MAYPGNEIRSLIQQRELQAVVIGASAGAIDALSAILPALPEKLPFSVLIVVHIPPDRDSILAEIFAKKCAVNVSEAEDKEPLLPGTVYFAPPNYHILVEADHVISLSNEEPVFYSRPSIDVLFESAADVYGSQLLGIILTGANQDGARGLASVAAAGGIAIVQRPDQAEASLMPQAALEACPSAYSLSLEEIGQLFKPSQDVDA